MHFTWRREVALLDELPSPIKCRANADIYPKIIVKCETGSDSVAYEIRLGLLPCSKLGRDNGMLKGCSQAWGTVQGRRLRRPPFVTGTGSKGIVIQRVGSYS